MANQDNNSEAHGEWLAPARLMPTPHTATEKAAVAASLYATPTKSAFTKARFALGTAAVTLAVAVPNLSLEAMVSTISGPYFGSFGPEFVPQSTPTKAKAAVASLPTDVWTPAKQAAGPVYAQTLIVQDEVSLISSQTRFSSFDKDLPVALLEKGSQTFDLAFAGVEGPSPLAGLLAPASSLTAPALVPSRGSALATQTVAIEQITDIDLVVRATPEGAGPNQQSISQQALSVSALSARTDAISNQSVEAAFAGVIDVSSAARSFLPVSQRSQASDPRPSVTTIARAIPAGAPSSQVSASVAADALLVPKAKLDARVNGVLTGSVEFRQLDGTIAIQLRSVANMMREQLSDKEFAEIVGGKAIDTFMPLAQLQAAGIPVSYNPAYDEVEFGIDYDDAPNAKKVQIDQISVAPMGPALTAIEQIPR